MTTSNQQVVSSQTPAPAPQPAPAGGNGGFQWGQSGTGSASMAYGSIMELMAVMTEIQGMNSQQAGYSIQAAASAARNAYEQSMDAAKETKKADMLGAAGQFVSGAMGVVGVGLNSHSIAKTTTEETALGKENTELSGLDKALSDRRANGQALTVSSDPAAPAVLTRPKLSDKENRRIADLTTTPGLVRSAATETESATNNKVIANMTDDEVETFSDKLGEAEKINSEKINNLHTQRQSEQSNYHSYTQIIEGFAQGGLNMGSAIDKQNATQAQGMAALENSMSGMMNALYNNQAGQATQNQGKVLEPLQLLAQLNPVRG